MKNYDHWVDPKKRPQEIRGIFISSGLNPDEPIPKDVKIDFEWIEKILEVNRFHIVEYYLWEAKNYDLLKRKL